MTSFAELYVVDYWQYRAEGNANLVLQYIGPNPAYVGCHTIHSFFMMGRHLSPMNPMSPMIDDSPLLPFAPFFSPTSTTNFNCRQQRCYDCARRKGWTPPTRVRATREYRQDLPRTIYRTSPSLHLRSLAAYSNRSMSSSWYATLSGTCVIYKTGGIMDSPRVFFVPLPCQIAIQLPQEFIHDLSIAIEPSRPVSRRQKGIDYSQKVGFLALDHTRFISSTRHPSVSVEIKVVCHALYFFVKERTHVCFLNA